MLTPIPPRAIAAPLLALLLAAAAPQTAPAADPPQKTDRAASRLASPVRAQMLWDQGFELPPGSHLRFAKVDETPAPQGHTLHYRVFANAAQMGTAYTLSMWRIGTDIDDLEVITETAYVNRHGLLLRNVPNPSQQDADSLTDGSELDVTVQAARGEPIRFVLRSPDSKTMIGGTLVPYPIAAADKSCKLSALLGDPDANAVLFYADGFPPNSDLTVISVSQGATQQKTIRSDPKGHAGLIDLPHVKNADSGTVTETLRAGSCSVSVDVPWGRGGYHPL
jgi:hypothetical protein